MFFLGTKLLTLKELCGFAQESTRETQDQIVSISNMLEQELEEARSQASIQVRRAEQERERMAWEYEQEKRKMDAQIEMMRQRLAFAQVQAQAQAQAQQAQAYAQMQSQYPQVSREAPQYVEVQQERQSGSGLLCRVAKIVVLVVFLGACCF